MIEGVLFDLDGTLVDHRAAAQTAVAQLIANFSDSTLPSEELRDIWWSLEREHMATYLSGECSFTEQRRRRLRQFLPLLGHQTPSDHAELDAWFASNYLTAYQEAWRIFSDVSECLSELSAMFEAPLTAVVTNGDPEQQAAKLHRFNLLPSVGEVFTPSELGAAKPAPECFLAACAHLDLAPERTLYVGDWLEGDAVAASNAGLAGVWLDRGTHPVSGTPTSSEDCVGLPIRRIAALTELSSLVSSMRT